MNKLRLAIVVVFVCLQSFASPESPSITCQIDEFVDTKMVDSYLIVGYQASETNQDGVTRFYKEITKNVKLKNDPSVHFIFRAKFEDVDKFKSMPLRIGDGVYLNVRLDGLLVGLFQLKKMSILVRGCSFKDGLRK